MERWERTRRSTRSSGISPSGYAAFARGGEYERMRFGEASESDEASEIDEGYSETDEESEFYQEPESDDAFDDE